MAKEIKKDEPLEVKVSASKLKSLDECPLKFYNQYVLKIYLDTETHPSAAVGSIFHQSNERWYLAALVKNDASKLTLEALLGGIDEAFDICVKEKSFNLSKAYLDANTNEMKGITRELLVYFYEDMRRFGMAGLPLAVEKEFNITWPINIPGIGMVNVILNGFIDRIMKNDANELILTDYKTSSILTPQKKVDKDDQLTVYSAAYRKLAQMKVGGEWPEAEDIVELYFPKFRRSVVSRRNEEHFINLKNKIIKLVLAQVNKSQEATPSWNSCRFCNFKRTPYCSWGMG